jgi:hypothetical protein
MGERMNEFYVDRPARLAPNNLLVRARADADDALAYMVKHCDLDFAKQGYIFLMF